ncbi:penicillin-binding transpeptidase domain-containing protein [Streptococcus hyointestinalis]|uniref:penicillin-binding transpeptidase domain-containing protein n=1 Tax=Streptococcus hyointestinalis TaxID=1337 RepID=UPI003D2F3CD5
MNYDFTPGSVVKGATLRAPWQNRVLSGNEVLSDQGISGIQSWYTVGSMPITAEQALEYSTNTYMEQIAYTLMGQNYTAGSTL